MSDLSKTALILKRISEGEQDAINELVAHTYPMLLRWAHGRIPKAHKNLYETTDLVQETLMKGIAKTDDFESLQAGAFLAYLRKIFTNQINENHRKQKDARPTEFNQEQISDHATDDIEDFINYEKALNKLNPEEQQAIILRLEFGMTHAETAEAMEKTSEDAARMFTNRALLKLANHLKS